ncbi:hypothetical protein SAMN05421665_1243 [Yoonia rosea]|uniref:Uncharacterized protein n=2 Tax=Yoonia rosea TaxID=287098 RepID=A0A1R3WTJ8_9RHOB|nr:hypothetical protein SAMN05421665_1243 [Yoonia rosea]
MALKFFAVLSGVAGTGMWLLAFWALDDAVTNGTTAPAFTQGLKYGFYLWITAILLSTFADLVNYLKTIAENSEELVLIAQQSGSWGDDD